MSLSLSFDSYCLLRRAGYFDGTDWKYRSMRQLQERELTQDLI